MKSNLSVPLGHAFGVIANKIWPNPMQKRFVAVFFCFVAVSCTFKSVIDFEWVFMYGERVLEVHSCIFDYSGIPASFNEKTYFCIVSPFTFVENSLSVYMWVFFWNLCSVPLIYLSTSKSRLGSQCHAALITFMINLECSIVAPICSFPMMFWLFHVNFRIRLSIF